LRLTPIVVSLTWEGQHISASIYTIFIFSKSTTTTTTT